MHNLIRNVSRWGMSFGLILGATLFSTEQSARADDARAIQGTWQAVSAEREGAAVDTAGRTIIVTDNSLTFLKDNRQDGPQLGYRIQESTTPKSLDLLFTEGEAQVSVPGIYKLEGDTLTVCYTSPGRPRPSEFSTAEGDMCLLAVLKRKP